MSGEGLWQIAPVRTTFPLDRIEVWRAWLDSSEPAGEPLGLLSPDETTRAGRFHFARDHRRFVRCRIALRHILARYLELSPAEIRFRYEPNGKPEIEDDQNPSRLRFNVSHSAGLAMIALSSGRAIGVDLEQVRPDVACLELAQRFFSHQECQALTALPASQRRRAFFACWTRKEAFIKALGVGLSYPLADFSVSVAPDAPAALPEVRPDPDAVSRWFLANLQPDNGYVGTLAFEGSPCRIERLLWSLTDPQARFRLR